MGFFEKVVKMGADVNWVGFWDRTTLMEASRSGNYEMCRRLIKLGANINAADHNHSTALHFLCFKDNDSVDILELLLKNGADVHHTSNDQKNVLHFAAETGSLRILKRLLELGLDPNCVANDLMTPLHFLLGSNWGTDENDCLLANA